MGGDEVGGAEGVGLVITFEVVGCPRLGLGVAAAVVWDVNGSSGCWVGSSSSP